MTDYLKGNYKSPEVKAESKKSQESGKNEFEEKALERLGGSIAFVMKSKTFLWTPDADKDKANGKPEDKGAA